MKEAFFCPKCGLYKPAGEMTERRAGKHRVCRVCDAHIRDCLRAIRARQAGKR